MKNNNQNLERGRKEHCMNDNFNSLYDDGHFRVLEQEGDIFLEVKRDNCTASIRVHPCWDGITVVACGQGYLRPRNEAGDNLGGVHVRCLPA